MNNVDLYTIKEFLGHSRVTTTEIYTHINQEFKQSNIEKLTAIL
jgi:site-specific recombinase XerD